jgi:hypothetical protein
MNIVLRRTICFQAFFLGLLKPFVSVILKRQAFKISMYLIRMVCFRFFNCIYEYLIFNTFLLVRRYRLIQSKASRLPGFEIFFRHIVGSIGREIGLSQGLLPVQDNTNTHTQNADIHASCGIRTHDPSLRAVEDSTGLRLAGSL